MTHFADIYYGCTLFCCSSAPELVGLLAELNDASKQLETDVNPLLSKVYFSLDIQIYNDPICLIRDAFCHCTCKICPSQMACSALGT